MPRCLVKKICIIIHGFVKKSLEILLKWKHEARNTGDKILFLIVSNFTWFPICINP
jgi:hypothetical protein